MILSQGHKSPSAWKQAPGRHRLGSGQSSTATALHRMGHDACPWPHTGQAHASALQLGLSQTCVGKAHKWALPAPSGSNPTAQTDLAFIESRPVIFAAIGSGAEGREMHLGSETQGIQLGLVPNKIYKTVLAPHRHSGAGREAQTVHSLPLRVWGWREHCLGHAAHSSIKHGPRHSEATKCYHPNYL